MVGRPQRLTGQTSEVVPCVVRIVPPFRRN
jgi:hypothetical protein